MWPAFVVLTLVDGLVLHQWPPIRFGFSPTGLSFVAGVLIATFGNLVLIGAAAPWLARRLAERREGGPVPAQAEREVLRDRVGTALLALGFFGVLASGLASIPLINGETDARNRAAHALISYVEAHAPAEIKRNDDQGAVSTSRLADDYFRSCVAFDDRRRYWCVFIDTSGRPTQVVRDPSYLPNSANTRP
jgi:hypothetical protein